MTVDSEVIGHFFKTAKEKFSKCLEPTMRCENDAIRAHSIQNARVLDLLVEDDHVLRFGIKLSKDTPPRSELERIGRNIASTFLGLCSLHDGELFRPLDTKPLILSNREQLFLIAWRSVTRELHTVMEAARKGQGTLTWAVDTERAFPDKDGLIMREATGGLLKAYHVYRYRAENFDLALLEKRFSAIEHDVVVLTHTRPTLAVSSLFSYDDLDGDDPPYVILNVIPLSKTSTAVIFSYSKKHRRKLKKIVAPILKAKGPEQKLALSRIVIGRTENFVLSPAFVTSWPKQKKDAITRAFGETVLWSADAPHSPDMMLFE